MPRPAHRLRTQPPAEAEDLPMLSPHAPHYRYLTDLADLFDAVAAAGGDSTLLVTFSADRNGPPGRERHHIDGDPVDALWGVTVDPDVSAVAVVAVAAGTTRAVLCTRDGTTVTRWRYPPGAPRGAGATPPHLTSRLTPVLRRMLNLPTGLPDIPAWTLLANWLASTCALTAAALAVCDLAPAASVHRTGWAGLAMVAQRLGGLAGHPSPAAFLTADHDTATADALAADVRRATRTLTWAQLADSRWVGLLPAALQDTGAVAWAGENLTAWRALHGWPTVDTSLAALADLDPACAADTANLLAAVGWLDPANRR